MTTTDLRPTVLITGCSPGGIGHSLALSFAQRKLRVFATARPSSLDSLSGLREHGIEIIPLEVTSEESIQKCLATVKERTAGRGLNYLIHNAGINYTVPALDVDVDESRRVFESNFFAVVRITQVFFPLLADAQGTVVMIGSLAGVIPYVFGSQYNASKAALHAYANTLRVEVAPLGVKVITVVTGGVKSRLARVTRVLPEKSVYTELDKEYQRRQKHSQEGAMTNEAYAESVVSQVLEGSGPWPWRWFMRDARSRWIWEGNKSWLTWFLSGGWTWSGGFDWYFTRLFMLWKVKRQELTLK